MNLIAKYAVTCAVLAAGFLTASAQDDGSSSSSSSIVRRSGASGPSRRGEQTQQPGVTDRMREHFSSESNVSDADRMWMRVIYRDLEVKNPKNAALYFPEEVIDGQENLFRILMRLLANNQVAAYEYLDGKEIFSDQYRLKVRDMLDRFHVMYTEAKGSTEKNPKFAIDESDVPANEVLSYYILEKWEFDSRTNKTRRKVEAICPVLHRSDDFGGDAVRYPMFWIKMNDIRPYLAQQYIFIDDDNNLQKYTYDDFFRMSMYDGDIYKTRNLTNRSMMQMFPDPDDLARAQDSIDNRLKNYGKDLWVPTREQYLAQKEKEEALKKAAAEADTIPERTVVSEDDGDDRSVRKSSTRTKKRTAVKTKKKRAAKPKLSSSGDQPNSGASKSVRRRRR